MDQLVASTLKYDLVSPVVMEFPGVTVGGAYAGTAGESSSFKIGLFARSVRSVEMVLGDGDVIQASKDNNADLFYGAARTLDTLGFVTGRTGLDRSQGIRQNDVPPSTERQGHQSIP